MGDTTYRRLEETQVSILEEQQENRERLSQIADGIGQSNVLLAEMISELRQNRRSPSMGSYRGRSPNLRQVSLHTLNETTEQNDENEEETLIHHQDAVDPPQNEEETDMDLFPRLVRSGEMDALIQLKILEYKRDASTGSRLIAHRRGNRETSPDYETRLYNTASNFILTELRSGVNVNVLFERLSPLRRQARFEDARPNTRATSSNTLHVRPDRRVNELSENTSRREQPQTPRAQPSPLGSGDGNSDASRQNSAGSPIEREPPLSYVSRRLRPSMSISHLGEPLDAGPPTNTNRSSERTDKIVRGEIRDAYRASQFRSDKINIGKMMKIPLPEYSGGESIDSFIKFLREILLYLVNYNVMGPDDDASRVGILGSTLKDRALKWYQHTIHLNADGSWTFKMAMIELKRYFVKEASSRDAATKFDRLEQGSRTVMELHKDLERLSQQMVQTPTEYDMS